MGRHAAKKLEVADTDISFVDGHYGPQKTELRRGRDDFLIRRSDGVFAYQLAVSVDDMEMGITRVVRARDLLDSTPRQIWLIETLGGRAPEYAHTPLLVASDGRKLSKREGDLNMEALRQKYTPEQLTGKLAKLAGLRPTVTAIELAADFSWDKIPRADNLRSRRIFNMRRFDRRIQTDAPIFHAIIFSAAGRAWCCAQQALPHRPAAGVPDSDSASAALS